MLSTQNNLLVEPESKESQGSITIQQRVNMGQRATPFPDLSGRLLYHAKFCLTREVSLAHTSRSEASFFNMVVSDFSAKVDSASFGERSSFASEHLSLTNTAFQFIRNPLTPRRIGRDTRDHERQRRIGRS